MNPGQTFINRSIDLLIFQKFRYAAFAHCIYRALIAMSRLQRLKWWLRNSSIHG
jgi:hypothetical protein